MPVRVVQHPLVEDVLARLRDKTTPSEEFRQLSPTGWRCSSWLKPPATCPCRTSRPDGGHGRVGGHGDRARRRPGGPPALDRGGARRVFTAALDRCLNDRKYILPGLGDF